jgi:hypothetical protein
LKIRVVLSALYEAAGPAGCEKTLSKRTNPLTYCKLCWPLLKTESLRRACSASSSSIRRAVRAKPR